MTESDPIRILSTRSEIESSLGVVGHGKMLLDWSKGEAQSHDCSELHLDSGVRRFGAHPFCLREPMDMVTHHFRITL